MLFEYLFQAVARQISAGRGDLVDRRSGIDQEIFRLFEPLRDDVLIDGSLVRGSEQFFQVRRADSCVFGDRFQRKRLIQVAVDIEQRFFQIPVSCKVILFGRADHMQNVVKEGINQAVDIDVGGTGDRAA